jgi:hypothetical protein|nr:MAG TPA: hypothetical protein [Caudoviricetes sp.]
MYVAKFERYWNDYRRKDETKTFSGLAELENWMFGQMQQDYTKDFVMTFPTPAATVRGPSSFVPSGAMRISGFT